MAVSLERALQVVLAAAGPLPTEPVPVADAAGRVLAAPLIATADAPPHTNSAMDGFAVTAGPAARRLRLIGESRAGAPSPVALAPGTAIQIATGGVLPAGAEAVVPLEQATAQDGFVTLDVAVAPGRNIRRAGEDLRRGEVALPAATRVGAVELVVAIGAGAAELVCHRRPRVAVLGTGDELCEPGSDLGPGQIHDSNTIALAALARDFGAVVVRREHVADDPAAIRTALDAAFAAADLVVVSGGVSVGPHDHVKPALLALGAQEGFAGVEIRPGRPTWFGRRGPVHAIGLPGNPVSAMVTFVLLGRPLLAALAGLHRDPVRERAWLTHPLRRHPQRTGAVGVSLQPADGGRLACAPTGPPGSHLTTSLLGADALALVPAGAGELPAGSEVEIERLWR
jgi:molybdopterin molybdotransferase